MYQTSEYNHKLGTYDIITYGPCTLEFIIDDLDYEVVKNNAIQTIREFSGKTSRTENGTPLYDFGNLRAKDILKDVAKVFKINCNSEKKELDLWLDESFSESYWYK